MSKGRDSTDEATWVRVLSYLSKFIIPLCLSGVCIGGMHTYSSIQANTLNVDHIQTDVKRLSTDGQIQRIAIEKVNDKVTTLEALLPQILNGIDDIKSDIKGNRKYQKSTSDKLGILSTDIAVLKDRDKRTKKDKG